MVDDCCTTAFLWNGKPTGREETIGENAAYVTGTNTDVAVLLIPDLFGWTLNNLRLLADHFAKEANCTCYVVDFFGGEVLPEDKLSKAFADPAIYKLLDVSGFVSRNTKEIRGPEIFACARLLKSKYSKVGAVGYCYGGWACLQLGAKGNELVDCISIAHPSLCTKDEIDALGVPTQIVAPEKDPQLTPELKEYCNRVIPGLGLPYMYDYYPGLAHGFAAKGDPRDLLQKEGLERAKNSFVFWLNQFLHRAST